MCIRKAILKSYHRASLLFVLWGHLWAACMNLHNLCKAFLLEGHSRLTSKGIVKLAKSYNIIRERLFEVLFDQVGKCCQQCLGPIAYRCAHKPISLGILQWLLNLFEEEGHRLDCQYASIRENEQTGPVTFDSHVNDIMEIHSREQQKRQLTQHLACLGQTLVCISLTTWSCTDRPLQAQVEEIVGTLSWCKHTTFQDHMYCICGSNAFRTMVVKTFHVQEEAFVRTRPLQTSIWSTRCIMVGPHSE